MFCSDAVPHQPDLSHKKQSYASAQLLRDRLRLHEQTDAVLERIPQWAQRIHARDVQLFARAQVDVGAEARPDHISC